MSVDLLNLAAMMLQRANHKEEQSDYTLHMRRKLVFPILIV